MPECVKCCGPVASRGLCTECDLERQFGTGDYDEEADDE